MNMKAKIETDTSSTGFDIAVWVVIVAVLLVGIVANAYFSYVAAPIRIALWIVAFLLLAIGALQTQQGKLFFDFTKDVRMELRKVVWPLRQQTIKTTGLVIVAVIIFALILWAIDSTLLYAVSKLTG